jgi:hypothetical protein
MRLLRPEYACTPLRGRKGPHPLDSIVSVMAKACVAVTCFRILRPQLRATPTMYLKSLECSKLPCRVPAREVKLAKTSFLTERPVRLLPINSEGWSPGSRPSHKAHSLPGLCLGSHYPRRSSMQNRRPGHWAGKATKPLGLRKPNKDRAAHYKKDLRAPRTAR